MRRILLTGIMILICVAGLNAQAPKYSNEFLAIGIGARALAMSNSNTAIVEDVSAGYWNPAGLMKIQPNLQLSVMHAEYFAGIAKFDYGAIAAQIDASSTAAFSFIRFGVDDIPNTTELIDAEGNIDYNRISTFSAADYAFLLSYARNSKISGLRYGANVKVIYRKVGDFAHAWGFGLDLGLQYELNKWRFGAMARDITSTFNAWNYNLSQSTIDVFNRTGNEIPNNDLELTLPRLSLGAGRLFDLGKKFTALADVDMDLTFDGMRNVLVKSDPLSLDPHVGLEFGYGDIVFLRGGFGNFQQERNMEGKRKWSFQPNLGVGVTIKKLVTIDYALTDIGNASIALYSNIFSLKFNINAKRNRSNNPDARNTKKNCTM
jgi:hypothetical protein